MMKHLSPMIVALALLAPTARAQCWEEAAKLTKTVQSLGDRFGKSVAISVDTAVVGVPDDDNNLGADAGIAFLHDRDQGGPDNWGKSKGVRASDGTPNAHFGRSVSIAGSTAVVGSPGSASAYVFERDLGGPGAWGERRKLTASTGSALELGSSVWIDADTVVVGAPAGDGNVAGSGTARVFERDAGGPDAWGEVALLAASDGQASDRFGASVSIAGDTVVVGAPGDDDLGADAGSVYVFERDQGGAGNWGQVAKRTASDGETLDRFGISVSLDGDVLAVGAPQPFDSPQTGAAYLFERDLGGLGNWGELAQLNASDGDPFHEFGISVSVGGERVAVGAWLADGTAPGLADGAVYVFDRNLGGVGTWKEAKLGASDPDNGDGFGWAVSVSGDRAAVGAPFDGGVGSEIGSAYVFDWNPSSPVVPYCTAGLSASGCAATLSATGAASATAATGFAITAANVEGAVGGLFFYGAGGRMASSWGNGTSYRCVAPPVHRGGLLGGSGTPGACDGSFGQDLNARWCPTCPKPSHNPGEGVSVQLQLWYRDPLNTSNMSTGLSNAIEFCVGA